MSKRLEYNANQRIYAELCEKLQCCGNMSLKKKLLFNISVILGIVILLGTALLFLSSKIQDKAEQISDAKKELNIRSKTVESIALFRRKSEQVQPYLRELQNMLITKDDLINIPKDLKSIAQQNQVNLQITFGVDTPRTETEPGEINIAITTEGSFDNLIKFLKDLENSRYFVKLNKVDLTARGDDNFRAVLSGAVFYF